MLACDGTELFFENNCFVIMNSLGRCLSDFAFYMPNNSEGSFLKCYSFLIFWSDPVLCINNFAFSSGFHESGHKLESSHKYCRFDLGICYRAAGICHNSHFPGSKIQRLGIKFPARALSILENHNPLALSG